MSEVMINENEELRNMWLKYLRKEKLQRVKSEIEEQRNMRFIDKRQR